MKYDHKLRDKYFENAREYTSSVYVPLNVALTKLSEAYQTFRLDIDFEDGSVDTHSADVFISSCDEYLEHTRDLFARGGDAFLTMPLDEGLRSFNVFIRRSLSAKSPVVKLVLKYQFRVPGMASMSTEGEVSKEIRMDKQTVKHAALRYSDMSVSLWVFGGVATRCSDVLAAPVASREFEDQITQAIPELKDHIKRVALGSHADP